MKTIQKLATSTLLLSGLFFITCSSDDDNTPEIINEEEVITTVNVTLISTSGTVTLSSVDLDGDGPDDPVVTISGNLAANETYAGSVKFLNETESPAEDITEEVEEESNEHQVFVTAGGGANFASTPINNDSDGNPLGTEFTVATGDASTGTLTITLRHEPTKPNNGLADAGGETDIEVSFPVTIE